MGRRSQSTDASRHDLTTGVAFDGADEGKLLSSLDISLGKIISGQFTRSKPVVNVLGTEMFVGYMQILQGLEWQGKLDAIDIIDSSAAAPVDTVTTGDSSYVYLWRYGTRSTPRPARTVYTSLNPIGGQPDLLRLLGM